MTGEISRWGKKQRKKTSEEKSRWGKKQILRLSSYWQLTRVIWQDFKKRLSFSGQKLLMLNVYNDACSYIHDTIVEESIILIYSLYLF